jgi:hypothetical protein
MISLKIKTLIFKKTLISQIRNLTLKRTFLILTSKLFFQDQGTFYKMVQLNPDTTETTITVNNVKLSFHL